MATNYNTRLPSPSGDLISLIDASNPQHIQENGVILDGVTKVGWSRVSVNNSTLNGLPVLDMDVGYLNLDSNYLNTFYWGQYYTHFYLWYPRTTDAGWRTLYRNNFDHLGIVSNGGKNLGMYSNRNGGFRDCGYDISIEWQTLIITGEGDSSTSSTGTSTFYVNGSSEGTSDRVGCGTATYRVGWGGQGPGKISLMGAYNRLLTATEIQQLHHTLVERLP